MTEAPVLALVTQGAARPPATDRIAAAGAGGWRHVAGYLVVDARGRALGRVVEIRGGSVADASPTLVLRRFPLRRRRLVSGEAIDQIDERTRVVGLRFERHAFLPTDIPTSAGRAGGKEKR